MFFFLHTYQRAQRGTMVRHYYRF
jgi:hypothetical protein